MRNAAVITLLALIAVAGAASAGTADTVAVNGKIYTSNADQPWAEAVAITGTDIVYVGDNEGARAFIGKETTVADLKGKMMLPGLIGTHEHGTMMMALSSGLTMSMSRDAEIMLGNVKEYVASHPDGPYFSFGGAFEGTVEIYRDDLDAIISDKPFLMIAASGHGGWCNTKALEVAGIVKDEPDPIDSFAREADGTPNGYVGSSAAVFYMIDKLNLMRKKAILEQADGVLAQMSKLGVTATYEVAYVPGTEETMYSAISELEQQGRLNVRIVAAVMIQRPRHIEGALAALKKFGPMYSSELFNVNTLKVHGDGAFEGRTAGLLEPYSDAPDSRGLVSLSPEELGSAMVEAARAGYNVHTHAIGDWTNRAMLDGMQAVREAGFADTRLSMGHTMLVTDQDKPRFKELDVSVNTFAAENAVPSEVLIARLGKERYRRLMPMKSFLDMGVRVGLSADWPTGPLNPFLQMSIAMTRSNPGQAESLPPASERLSLEQAIRAYTIDAAYLLDAEGYIGSIEVGKRADLIVIDRNLFELTPDEIAETDVLVTMMNGRVVHEEAVDWNVTDEILEAFSDFEFYED